MDKGNVLHESGVSISQLADLETIVSDSENSDAENTDSEDSDSADKTLNVRAEEELHVVAENTPDDG